MKADPGAADLVRAITPKVAPFAMGDEIAPGITTVAVDGHTPGHAAAEIASQGERLLYIGDTAHHSVISVQRPDWTIQFDGDAPTAQASRRETLRRASAENLRIFSPHFPFPGLGRFRSEGDGYVWVAD